MNKQFIEKVAADTIEWALMNGLAFKSSADSARHVPFSLTPTKIAKSEFELLKRQGPLLNKLIHNVSKNHQFLVEAIQPVTTGDPFFRALLDMHLKIKKPKYLPLLISRHDFMLDEKQGPKLVEFNSIAAGMGPFGQVSQELHQYFSTQWPSIWDAEDLSNTQLENNQAIEALSQGIALATKKIKDKFQDNGQATFLMIVQDNEDNVYDQHLLERALNKKGIRTVRRTFRELYNAMSSGVGDRLILEGVGTIDCVYLRAGYQFSDYVGKNLNEQRCCQSLMETRTFIEKHRVAINATVSQQLATSKRVQYVLSSMTPDALTQFDLSIEEATEIKTVLGNMTSISNDSLQQLKGDSGNWVLKNQGEGGGHCIFDEDIVAKIEKMKPENYPSWVLMKRLFPSKRQLPALTIRKGKVELVENLVSEIGIFSIHIDGTPANDSLGYAGYLVRSKGEHVEEGGIHSGMGVLDSLAINES